MRTPILAADAEQRHTQRREAGGAARTGRDAERGKIVRGADIVGVRYRDRGVEPVHDVGPREARRRPAVEPGHHRDPGADRDRVPGDEARRDAGRGLRFHRQHRSPSGRTAAPVVRQRGLQQ